MTFPDASTRVAGVLGHPIGHSLSPVIHNAALRHEGRNGVYLAFEVREAELPRAVAGLRALGATGVNVTLPLKQNAAQLADERSELVERVGAANTLVFEPAGIRAENTDVAGITAALSELGLRGVERALVLGAGGSARAAVTALSDSGISVAVANRTFERATALARALRRDGDEIIAVDWDERGPQAIRVDLVVNCTSVGLGDDQAPLPPDALAAAAVGRCRAVLDLVYAPDETALVRAARGAGLLAADGLTVLVHQAAVAYRLMWGATPSVEAMTEAAAAAVGRRPASDDVPPIV